VTAAFAFAALRMTTLLDALRAEGASYDAALARLAAQMEAEPEAGAKAGAHAKAAVAWHDDRLVAAPVRPLLAASLADTAQAWGEIRGTVGADAALPPSARPWHRLLTAPASASPATARAPGGGDRGSDHDGGAVLAWPPLPAELARAGRWPAALVVEAEDPGLFLEAEYLVHGAAFQLGQPLLSQEEVGGLAGGLARAWVGAVGAVAAARCRSLPLPSLFGAQTCLALPLPPPHAPPPGLPSQARRRAAARRPVVRPNARGIPRHRPRQVRA
jgi:hypothetical protein